MGIAAKHLDPIVGLDMHMVQPPAPAPPIMMPIPVAGYLIDPNDYGSCKVRVNQLPPARAGTPGVLCPPHIPPGGVFIKPPTNECEMFQGSSTVVFAGEAAAAQGHPVLSCHDVGMPAPVRAWRRAPTKSLMLATANVIPIPGPSVVMINGAPTITMAAQAQEAQRESEPPALVSIRIMVLDALELPLANERFALHLPNGDIEEGTLDVSGSVTVSDVPTGYASIVFPDIDAPPRGRSSLALPPFAIDGARTLPPLPKGTDITVVVEEDGVAMRALCQRAGLVHWRAMLLDGANSALREDRADPTHLLAEDEVHVRVPERPAIRYLREGAILEITDEQLVYVEDWPRVVGFSD